jgi:AcrR family transcriptional regulator
MDRPVDRQAGTGNPDRRAQYLAAAQQLFATHGYVGTSMDMLIAEVGGSKATLYKHFPSKESLVAGLMDAVATAVSRNVMDDLDGNEPLRDALEAIGEATLRGVVSPTGVAVLRICLAEAARFPDLARTVWGHGPAVTYANFRRFLADRVERGELDVDDFQLAAEQFLAGIVGHIQLKVAMGVAEPPDDDEIRIRVESAIDTFLARYEQSPTRSSSARQ